MARAHGYRGKLLMALEGALTYGTLPAAGEFHQLPFVSADLGGEQGLEEDDTLGLGRDPQAPTYDLLKVSGQIVVPLDLRYIGFWLQAAMGVVTPADSYSHTWVSGGRAVGGGNPLRSVAIELQFPEVPAYFRYTGVMVESFQLSVSRSGKPQLTLQVVGQNEAKATSSIDATPIDSIVQTRFHKFNGKVQQNDGGGMDDLSNLVSADMAFANGLATVDTVRADALTEGIDATRCKLSGNLVARFGDTILLDYAAGQTAVPLAYVFTQGTSSLTLTARAAYLPKAKRSLSGPGGVEATYAWQGAKSSAGSNNEMLQVVLVNDVVSYANGTPD